MIFPKSWSFLEKEIKRSYFKRLLKFLEKEKELVPAKKYIFNALKKTPHNKVKVVILGKGPPLTKNKANGLAFAAQGGSLTTGVLYEALKKDLKVGVLEPNLEKWASEGVLLLDTVLTSREGELNAHRNMGWEIFVNGIINSFSEPKVFVLWGLEDYRPLIPSHHKVILGPYPNKFNEAEFIKKKFFSKINEKLKALNLEPIDW